MAEEHSGWDCCQCNTHNNHSLLREYGHCKNCGHEATHCTSCLESIYGKSIQPRTRLTTVHNVASVSTGPAWGRGWFWASQGGEATKSISTAVTSRPAIRTARNPSPSRTTAAPAPARAQEPAQASAPASARVSSPRMDLCKARFACVNEPMLFEDSFDMHDCCCHACATERAKWREVSGEMVRQALHHFQDHNPALWKDLLLASPAFFVLGYMGWMYYCSSARTS